jgi:hypothetical protein
MLGSKSLRFLPVDILSRHLSKLWLSLYCQIMMKLCVFMYGKGLRRVANLPEDLHAFLASMAQPLLPVGGI